MTDIFNETRFACRCGRFVAESSLSYTVHRDDGRYYGIRDEVEWDCSRCGKITADGCNEPLLVVVAEREWRDRCDHQWIDRPASDCRECLVCGEQVFFA